MRTPSAGRGHRLLRSALALTAAVVVAGCTDSAPQERGVPVPQEQGAAPGEGGGAPTEGDLVVTGALRGTTGEPLAGRRVLLSREMLGRDVLADTLLALGTGGTSLLSCFGPDGSVVNACRPGTFTTTAEADGRFALRLTAEERLSAFGGERSFALDAAMPDGGGARAVFPVDSALVDVPDLTAWAAGVGTAGDAAAQRVSWAAPPEQASSEVEYAVTFADPGRGLVLERRADDVELAVDARLLEDSAGSITTTAEGPSAQAPAVALSWTAPPVAYTGAGGAPPTRSTGCTVAVEALPDAGQPACWLTDGAYAAPYPGERPTSCRPDGAFTSCARAAVTRADLDLGRVLDLGLVVLRGTCDSCRVQVSTDGSEWTTLAGDDGGAATETLLRPALGTQARFVRVGVDPEQELPRPEELELPQQVGPEGFQQPTVQQVASLPPTYSGDLSGLTELSAWPPTEEERARAAERGPLGGLGSDTPAPAPVTLLAVALVAATGAGVVLARRRR